MTKITNKIINDTKNTIINQLKDTVYGKDRNRIILVVVTKDSSETIEGCLNSTFDLVDGMCVFDIGSKDNTEELVKEYFKDINMPTKFAKLNNINNGQNKTNAFNEAVKFCKMQKWYPNKTYCLFINPEEELSYVDKYDKELLTQDCYKLITKDGVYKTYSEKLLRMDKDWISKGKVNEFWTMNNSYRPNDKQNIVPEFTTYKLDENIMSLVFIPDIEDEVYNEMLSNNIKIMESDDINNTRNMFYMAEHYYELYNYEEALNWYYKRLKFKNNDEEEYLCYLRIAECKVELVYDEEDIKNTYFDVINRYPFMLEPVYNLMYFYYVVKDWKTSFDIGKLGINIICDNLPFKYEYKVYEYKFKEKMLEICLKNGNYGLGVKFGLELLHDKLYDREDKYDIKRRYKKCLEKLTETELGITTDINKHDINIILLSDKINNNLINLYNNVSSFGYNISVISNETNETLKTLNIEDKKLLSEGWYNLNNNETVSLLDKGTYHAFSNKYKYTWFINNDVSFTNDLNRLQKLLQYNINDDLLTTELSEDNENMKKILEDNSKKILNISKDMEDWMSSMNNICRVSYNLLSRLNEFRIIYKKLENNEFLLPTLCNKHIEMKISYFSELDLPIMVQKRKNLELNTIEKNVINNVNTYYFNISILSNYESEIQNIKKYYTINKDDNTLLDYSGNNQVKLFIDDNIDFKKSELILINGLKNKNIIISHNDDNTEYDHKYYKENYNCMEDVLKDILENIAHSTERLLFLNKIFDGEDIVILSGGPSTGLLSNNELNYIFDNYLTICIKYVINILEKNNLKPTFNLFNQYLASGSFDDLIEKARSYNSIFGSDGSFIDETALMMVEVKDEHFCIRNFKRLLRNNIDCLTWMKDENNKRYYLNLHIMCELALPLAIHLGIKNIYTVGWDLKPINNQDYCFSSNKKIYEDNKISEYDYVPDIEKILNNMGITINKIKESPILLNMVDFFKNKNNTLSCNN